LKELGFGKPKRSFSEAKQKHFLLRTTKPFPKILQKKFGVDGMILFDSEETENMEFAITHALTKSLFNYLSKKNKLCEKCDK
jgi:hypothetical protein